MKNKISFTSVLKSKASVSSRMINGSSQYSIDSQPRYQHQRLMDIYQQYESYPEQDYTLDFSAMSRNMGYNNNSRSRNSSMNIMSRSKNVSQDPQMSLQMWIQKQKKGSNNNSNYESFNSNMNNGQSYNNMNNNNIMMMKPPQPQSQKSFKQTLTLQQQSVGNNRRSKSSYNGNTINGNNHNNVINKNNLCYQQQQLQCEEDSDYQLQQQQHDNFRKSKAYEQQQPMRQPQQQVTNNNSFSQKWNKKSPINFKSQPNNINENIPAQQSSNSMQESSNKLSPQQFLAAQQIKSKTHYPQLQDNDYNKLKQEFEKLKNQKIAQLCMHAKKSVKKEKLRQIISKALENIYDDIEQMAEKMVEQRKNNMKNNKNMDIMKKLSQQQEHSQSMLISGQYQQQQQDQNNEYYQQREEEMTDREEQERRQQQMRNMIKGYISGIQQAKSHQHSTKIITEYNNNHQAVSRQSMRSNSHTIPQHQHSFNNNPTTTTMDHNNTFNNYQHQQQDYKNQFNYHQQQQNGNGYIKNDQEEHTDAVGYSFANNNSNMMVGGCQHSFNRELGTNNSGVFYHYNNNNNNSDTQTYHQQSNFAIKKPQVYQPQQSFSQQYQQQQQPQQQQRISLPNIQQVKSDCGDLPIEHYQQRQVQSSEEIEMKIRNNKQYQLLNVDNDNIKNIQSVHYEAPASEQKLSGGYFEFNYMNCGNGHNSKKDLFKNFEELNNDTINKARHTNNDQNTNNNIIINNNKNNKSDQRSSSSSQSINNNINKASFSEMLRSNQNTNNDNSNNINREQISKQQNISSNTQHKFISKTFNSYLSGQMRGEYGQAVRDSCEDNIKIQSSNKHSGKQMNTIKPITTTLSSPKTQQKSQMNHQSINMSMNNSLHQPTQQSITMITSPKTTHQLSSKTKFSINSPMTKIDQIMKHQQQQMIIQQKNNIYNNNSINQSTQGYVNEFKSFVDNKKEMNNSKSRSSSPYAVSSPLGGKVGDSFNNNNNSMNITNFNNNIAVTNHQYACAQSINKTNKNSIFDIQPLKLSPTHNNNNTTQTTNNTNISHNHPSSIAKLTQSVENNKPYFQITKQQPNNSYSNKSITMMTINYNNNSMSNNSNSNPIMSGRNFLQSLHEKQSIELSPSNRLIQQGRQQNQCKQSFAAETFRPNNAFSDKVMNEQSQNNIIGVTNYPRDSTSLKNQISPKNINSPNTNSNNINQSVNNNITIMGSNNRNSNNNKLSITKITLRSSDRQNNISVTSPKVISLSINNNMNNLSTQQQKQKISQFSSVNQIDGKQNIFQKLTIKSSVNIDMNSSTSSSLSSNLLAVGGVSNQSQQQQQNNTTTLKQSIKHSDNFINIKTNHQNNNDLVQSKENNNTMNNSIQLSQLKSKQDNNNNINNNNKLKQSLSITNKPSITILEKKQPLLKLSKNLTNSINQSQQQQINCSINNNNTNYNIKKSIGESIRNKVHQPGMMITSKNNMLSQFGSTRQSFNRGGVKQSIGNDSDMDFDLELD